MDALQKTSGPLNPRIKKELAQLKSNLLLDVEMPEEDAQLLLSWIDQLPTSPFACHLFSHKAMDGNWPVFCQDQISFLDKFIFSQPSVKALQKRYEKVKTFLDQHLSKQMTIAVYPANYAGEWTFLEQEASIHVIGILDKSEFMMNEAAFDIVIKNAFLFGDQHIDDDVFHYVLSSLKPGGLFLNSLWLSVEDPENQEIQQSLFFEKLLGMPKGDTQSIGSIKTRLRHAGFDAIQTLNDESCQLRTLAAKKPPEEEGRLKFKRLSAHNPRRMSRKSVCCKNLNPVPT